MNRSDRDRARVIRAWLGEGSTQLSPRVHDDVLREFPAISQDRPFRSSKRFGPSTIASTTAAAAAVVVVAVAGSSLLGGSPLSGTARTATPSPPASSPTPRPSDFSKGFIGLPPIGATPTDPSATELVERFAWVTPPSRGYDGGGFLYADGRLIWNDYLDMYKGWLEQRVTGEGIELVRRLGIGTADPEVGRLLERDEMQGLPERAWVDQTIRPYVPNGFAACLFVLKDRPVEYPESPADTEITLTEKRAMLPEAAREILSGKVQVFSLAYADTPGLSDCLGMSTAEARQLDAALRDEGFEEDPLNSPYILNHHIDLDGDGPGIRELRVWFEPILPDGTVTCSACG